MIDRENERCAPAPGWFCTVHDRCRKSRGRTRFGGRPCPGHTSKSLGHSFPRSDNHVRCWSGGWSVDRSVISFAEIRIEITIRGNFYQQNIDPDAIFFSFFIHFQNLIMLYKKSNIHDRKHRNLQIPWLKVTVGYMINLKSLKALSTGHTKTHFIFVGAQNF